MFSMESQKLFCINKTYYCCYNVLILINIYCVLGEILAEPNSRIVEEVNESSTFSRVESCVVCEEIVDDSDEYAVGCDNVTCLKWYHRQCLEPDDRATSDMSIMTNTDWLCPVCVENLIRVCGVCLLREYVCGENEHEWVRCKQCELHYHLHHFSEDYLLEIETFGKNNWNCPNCQMES